MTSSNFIFLSLVLFCRAHHSGKRAPLKEGAGIGPMPGRRLRRSVRHICEKHDFRAALRRSAMFEAGTRDAALAGTEIHRPVAELDAKIAGRAGIVTAKSSQRGWLKTGAGREIWSG
ncbi:MAG: hypothetical protein QM651_17725 [Rhodoblastus sp.]